MIAQLLMAQLLLTLLGGLAVLVVALASGFYRRVRTAVPLATSLSGVTLVANTTPALSVALTLSPGSGAADNQASGSEARDRTASVTG